jgi:hypothetical protein
MAGGLAEAFYTQVPVKMIETTWDLLPEDFHKVIIDFYKIIDAKQSK